MFSPRLPVSVSPPPLLWLPVREPQGPEPVAGRVGCARWLRASLARRSLAETPQWCSVSLLITILFLFPGTTSANELPPLIPLEDFFRNPEKTSFQLSPGGEYVAYLAPWQKRLNIYVQKVGEKEGERVTNVAERDIARYLWVSDDRLVYLKDEAGNENWSIFGISRTGGEAQDLTPFADVQARLIEALRFNPEHVLISLNNRDKRFHDAYRLNVNTGDIELLVENNRSYVSYRADHSGIIRLATATDGVNVTLFSRKSEEDEFKPILRTNFRERVKPLFFTYDNRHFFASSNLGRDKTAIFVIDPETGEEIKKVYENRLVDVYRVHRSDKRKVVEGASYNFEKWEHTFFDNYARDIFQRLEGKFPGMEVSIGSRNLEEDQYLVRTRSVKTPGSYYHLDLATFELTLLSDIAPWIDPVQMGEVHPIAYLSRDELTIYGYLTLPKGVKPVNLPVVINPHGGPWSRNSWRYSAKTQFLANRGYAVLQMNYRGSTGYGRTFWEASFKQWGKKMLDDVTDGVRWLIAEGVVDPERVGIYGGSFGGYTTLAAITLTPELYVCGVDYVGISNIFTWLDSFPPYWESWREMAYEMVGHPERDEELLRAASPVFHVERIRAPLLIAQGSNDPRVKKAESDQMVEALQSRGIDVPYMVKENEGHGFRLEENRLEFYRAMEQFLAKHLGGRLGEGKDVLGSL